MADECFCQYRNEPRGGALFEAVLVPNPDCPAHGSETVSESEGLGTSDGHVFDGERCIHCNVNVYDDGIYGPFKCTEREPHVHTTETGAPGH